MIAEEFVKHRHVSGGLWFQADSRSIERVMLILEIKKQIFCVLFELQPIA